MTSTQKTDLDAQMSVTFVHNRSDQRTLPESAMCDSQSNDRLDSTLSVGSDSLLAMSASESMRGQIACAREHFELCARQDCMVRI